jgi:hypothetical protein
MEIIQQVSILSRQKGVNYFDFIGYIGHFPLARKVKIADLEHNMSDLPEGSLRDKYRFAHAYLLEQEAKEPVEITVKCEDYGTCHCDDRRVVPSHCTHPDWFPNCIKKMAICKNCGHKCLFNGKEWVHYPWGKKCDQGCHFKDGSMFVGGCKCNTPEPKGKSESL